MTSQEFTPHAYITLSNCGGIEIMLNKSCDGVFYRFNYGQDLQNEEILESEIYYTSPEDENEESLAYFIHSIGGNSIYYLNEAMRINLSF